MNEKDMIARYIYEVTKRVPQETQQEISLELQSLIEDMCTEEGISVEEVLQKLGDPAEFAKRYRGDNNYLIGPDYYDNYLWVIKIAFIGIAISAVISAIIQGITDINGSMDTSSWINFFTNFFTNFLAELFATAINGTCSMVGIVTIIFAVLEWKKVKVSIKPESKWTVDELSKNVTPVKSWTPNSLPPIPDKRAVIRRGDSVFSIIFITVFATLLLLVPQLFGAFHYDGNTLKSIACVFNLKEWDRIAPLLVLTLFICLVDEIIKLVTGYYCKPVMYSSIICNSLQLIGAVILLKFLPFWNPDFAGTLQEIAGITQFSDGDILSYWGTEAFNNMLLAFIFIISFLETGEAIYKTRKYS